MNVPRLQSNFYFVQSQTKNFPLVLDFFFAICFVSHSQADMAIRRLLAVLVHDLAKLSIAINLIDYLFEVKLKLVIILQAVLSVSPSDDISFLLTHFLNDLCDDSL